MGNGIRVLGLRGNGLEDQVLSFKVKCFKGSWFCPWCRVSHLCACRIGCLRV